MKIDKVVVFHIGARDQYSVSSAFSIRQKLVRLITDYYVKPNSLLKKILGNKVSRRYSENIPIDLVKAYSLLPIIRSEIGKKVHENSIFTLWLKNGERFEKFALKEIRRTVNKEDNYLIWGYSNTNLQTLLFLKNYLNVVTIHNQIDAGIEYYKVQQHLWEQHKHIQEKPTYPPKVFLQKMIMEWSKADFVVVNSNYSRRSLIKHGVSDNRIIVVPLSFNFIDFKKKKTNTLDILRIGFVGNINLIKGFYLFYQAAEELSSRFEFFAAGKSQLSQTFMDNAKEHINFTGHLNKEEMESFYSDLDVLVFPTYSDGFGMVQLEAMARGIPVIASRNCGEVVEDQVNGYVVDNNHKQIVDKLLLLNENRDLLGKMSAAAKRRTEAFSIEEYNRILQSLLAKKDIYI